MIAYTSDIPEASTNSHVWVTMYGVEGKTEEYLLDTPNYNDHEQGKADKFNLESIGLVNVRKISVRRSNVNSNPSWHIDKVCFHLTPHCQLWK